MGATAGRLTRGAVLAAAVLCASAASAAQRARSSDGTIVAGKLGEALARAVEESGGPDFWGAVLVAREGDVLLARGYGMADYGETPNTPHTLFELASASKQVAGAAVAHLVQRKKLALDATLGALFDDVPEDKSAITVRQLLTHTSGISGSIGVAYRSPIGRADYVRKMLAEPLAAAPGERFEYCNAGYALLAAIVEEVAGGTFEKYCEKHLFEPAKLKDTGFIGDRDLARSGRVASRRTNEPGEWTAAEWHWGWGYKGMGGVVTTVWDLLAWDRALRRRDPLDDDAKAILYTPEQASYAGGWRIDVTERGTRKAHHSGSVAGFGCNVVRWLEDDACAFVLSNDPRAAHAVSAALEALLFEPLRLRARVDVQPYELASELVHRIEGGLSWRASAKRDELVVELVHADEKDHVLLEVRAPRSYAAKLAAELEHALAGRAPEAGEEAHVEARLYLQAYGASVPKVALEGGIAFDVKPEYRGRDAAGKELHDPRPLAILRTKSAWPVMAFMNAAAARELLDAVRAAAG